MTNAKGKKIDEQKNIGQNPRRSGFYPPENRLKNGALKWVTNIFIDDQKNRPVVFFFTFLHQGQPNLLQLSNDLSLYTALVPLPDS